MITTLSAYGFELGLDPAAGGTMAFFRLGETDILRTTLAGTSDPRDSAAFPLVPFSGRISDGRFDFAGRTIVLPANMPPEPHAIHGHGWHAAWDLSKKSESHAVMRLEFPAGDWPWRYAAEQSFSLKRTGLQVEMTLENLSDTAMPAGLGWHPYFPRGDAQITCPVSGYWPADGSPCTEPTGDFDLSSGKTVDSIDIDTAFRGTGAPAHLFWPKRGL